MRAPAALLLAVTLTAASAAAAERLPHLDIQGRLSEVQVEREGGKLYAVIQDRADTRRLTPQQYFAVLEATQLHQREHGLLFVVFNITSWYGVLWVSFGLLAQAVFIGRFVVQWIASEKKHRSVVPTAFWWLSIVGATMLMIYFLWRKDVVALLGQSTGWVIYSRNLWLIYHRKAELRIHHSTVSN